MKELNKEQMLTIIGLVIDERHKRIGRATEWDRDYYKSKVEEINEIYSILSKVYIEL